MSNSDMPAMPISKEMYDEFRAGYCGKGMGLTKREHFAGLAMQGILANSSHYMSEHEVALDSRSYADALLKELEK